MKRIAALRNAYCNNPSYILYHIIIILHSFVYSTFGDFTRILSSPWFGSSTPPLKKKVTWAYFSVSAILAWVFPLAARNSPKVFVIETLWK